MGIFRQRRLGTAPGKACPAHFPFWSEKMSPPPWSATPISYGPECSGVRRDRSVSSRGAVQSFRSSWNCSWFVTRKA